MTFVGIDMKYTAKSSNNHSQTFEMRIYINKLLLGSGTSSTLSQYKLIEDFRANT